MTGRRVRLGALVTIKGGGTPDRGNIAYWGSGFPWATVKDLNGLQLARTQESITEDGLRNSASSLVPAGSLVIATRMALGKAVITSVDLAINQDLKALTCGPDVDARYLLHFLVSQASRIEGMGKGATVKGGTLDRLTELLVPVPPLAEQRRIAAILDKADGIRRKRRESINLLDEFLRSAFLEMFGDPVRNEKGWRRGTIGDAVAETQYGTGTKANSGGIGLPVLRMNNLTSDGAIDLTSLKWCEVADRDLGNYTLRRGDLLFNRTNSPALVGKAAVWDRDDAYAFAGYLVRVRFDESRALPDYISGYLNSGHGKRLLFEKAKPSNNMSNISASELLRLPVLLPPVAEQQRFAALVAATRKAEARLRVGEGTSIELFDSLAQRVFGGRAAM
jgi:type I restriction enzyme S subunit